MSDWQDHLVKYLLPSSGKLTVQKRAAKWLAFNLLRKWKDSAPELTDPEKLRALISGMYDDVPEHRSPMNSYIRQSLRKYYADKSDRQFLEAQEEIRRVLTFWVFKLKKEAKA
tara:strand:+ start:141 stop:479 length:339 start_codon:yes stop_codon:yes gene_type:complete